MITAIAAFVFLSLAVVQISSIHTIGINIQEQTLINQRYLRCILLLPREAFASSDSRVKALDKCAQDSRSTDGATLGGQ